MRLDTKAIEISGCLYMLFLSFQHQICSKSHQQLFLKTNRSHPKKIMFEDDFSLFPKGGMICYFPRGSRGNLVLSIGTSRRVGADPGEVDVVMRRPRWGR